MLATQRRSARPIGVHRRPSAVANFHHVSTQQAAAPATHRSLEMPFGRCRPHLTSTVFVLIVFMPPRDPAVGGVRAGLAEASVGPERSVFDIVDRIRGSPAPTPASAGA
jgi:hypothetical protein